MPIPSAAFRPGRLFCPSCGALLPKPVEACPRCEFTAALCLQEYPFDPPVMERIIDPEERFEIADCKRLNRAFNRFEKRFPQSALHVCMTRLPDNADCREFGYWLFNICQPRTPEEEARRYFGVLLVIDRKKRAVSVTLGYGLDPFIDDGLIKKLLIPAKASFQDSRYVDGVLRFLKGFDRQLRIECDTAREAAQWASRQVQALAQPVATETGHAIHPATDAA